MPGREQDAVMSARSIANSVPSERQLTGGILFLLAGLAALGALATNIILPAFPQIGAGLGVSSQELGLRSWAALALYRNRQEDRCDGLLSQAWERSRHSPQVSKRPGLVSWPAARASGGFRTM
jgi:hypothetical protein